MLSGVLNLDFFCDIQMVGSELGTHIKAWMHLDLQ